MSTYQLAAIAAIAGAGTFLIRFLPLLLKQEKGKKSTPYNRALHRGLAAIGPAAIVALLVVSLAGETRSERLFETVVPIVGGLGGVMLGRKLSKGSIAVATLAGVLAYAVVTALIVP